MQHMSAAALRHGTKTHVPLKGLLVVSVVVAGQAARGGCVGVRERHVAEGWCGVSLKVPKRNEWVP